MKKFLSRSSLIILTLVSIMSFSNFCHAFDQLEYNYLFRIIYDQHNPQKEDAYELAPVIYGRVGTPEYYFLPEKNQYLVSSAFTHFSFHGDLAADNLQNTYTTDRYVLLNDQGRELSVYDTYADISPYSGLFFHASYYVNWLETGISIPIKYSRIYNQDLSMNEKQLSNTFMILNEQSEYREIVRTPIAANKLDQDTAVVFKINNKWVILRTEKEERYFTRKYGSEIFRSPSIPVKVIAIETESKDEYRSLFNFSKLKLKHYTNEWNERSFIDVGTAFMQLTIKDSNFKFKIPNVQKNTLRQSYNLGVRIFKLPKEYRSLSSLAFVESTKNWNSSDAENLTGAGIYVVRPRQLNELEKGHKLPKGLTESHYQELPIPLQKALLDIEGTTALSISHGRMTKWLPEISLLKNLTYLKINTNLEVITDDISKLKKLMYLDVSNESIGEISPAISKLDSLRVINVSGNRLTSFPVGLLSLKNIEQIDLRSNYFTEIPSEISNLKNLKRLKLSLDTIKELPDSMATMEELSLNGLFDESENEKYPQKFHYLFAKKCESYWYMDISLVPCILVDK